MHVQILYEGPAESFSWVLPVPYQPKVSVGSDRIFTAMFTQTLPRFQLDIQQTETETCSQKDYDNIPVCLASEGAFAEDGGVAAGGIQPGSATVLDEGSVGPYDFVVIEAAENDPSSVFRWLEDNGYDQPEEAAPLLNYYALADHVFVALRLQKNKEVGEIQPLVLEYDMSSSSSNNNTTSAASTGSSNRTAIACIPIQLTRIAATPQMPITVYVLGDVRATPLNYMELQLDDTQVDWVGCLNGGPRCYDPDYRDRFNRAAMEIANHTFVTEYAGPASTMDGLIIIPVTKEQIAAVETLQEFLDTLSFLLPDIPLVDTILADYNNNMEGSSSTFNATALAEELHEKVLKPAIDDQEYVDSFAYMTRLYARLSPEMMNKDPFFAFKPELGDVPTLHLATGLPICDGGASGGGGGEGPVARPGPTALEITIETTKQRVIVPAGFGGCGGWVPFNPVVLVNETRISPALQVASYGFEGDDGIVVLRSENGTFDMDKVAEAIRFGDSLVMSQEIPDYDSNKTTTTTTQAPSSSSPSPTTEGNPTMAPTTTSPSGEGATMPPTIHSMVPTSPTTMQPTMQPPSTTNAEPTMPPSMMDSKTTVAPTLRAPPGSPATELPSTPVPSAPTITTFPTQVSSSSSSLLRRHDVITTVLLLLLTPNLLQLDLGYLGLQ